MSWDEAEARNRGTGCRLGLGLRLDGWAQEEGGGLVSR